jgi:hypothetical protein
MQAVHRLGPRVGGRGGRRRAVAGRGVRQEVALEPEFVNVRRRRAAARALAHRPRELARLEKREPATATAPAASAAALAVVMVDADRRRGLARGRRDAVRAQAAGEERERAATAAHEVGGGGHGILRDGDRRRWALLQRDGGLRAPREPLAEHVADAGHGRGRHGGWRGSGGCRGRGDGAARGFRVPVVFRRGGPGRVMRVAAGGSAQTEGWVVTIFFLFDAVEAWVWLERVSGDPQGTEMVSEGVRRSLGREGTFELVRTQVGAKTSESGNDRTDGRPVGWIWAGHVADHRLQELEPDIFLSECISSN